MSPIRSSLVRAYRQSDEGYRDRGRLAAATYRYLRIGMVMAVVALGVSIALERSKVACWQTSISAYYYTPVRAILVGGLIAIGASLIAIKGSNAFEDACLNVAGFLAPLVAVIPTEAVAVTADGRPACAPSVPEQVTRIRNPNDVDVAARWVRASIDNNVNTLLIVGGVSVVLVAALAFVHDRDGRSPWRRNPLGLALGLGISVVLIAVVFLLKRSWGAFYTRAHGYAAFGMFVFLALAVLSNALERRNSRRWPWLGIYAGTVVVMVVFGIYFQLISSWTYHVFAVECIEIAAFVVFWTAQTVQNWSDPDG